MQPLFTQNIFMAQTNLGDTKKTEKCSELSEMAKTLIRKISKNFANCVLVCAARVALPTESKDPPWHAPQSSSVAKY
jgi:hypothetical protein